MSFFVFQNNNKIKKILQNDTVFNFFTYLFFIFQEPAGSYGPTGYRLSGSKRFIPVQSGSTSNTVHLL